MCAQTLLLKISKEYAKMKNTSTQAKRKLKVAEFLELQITASGKTQSALAGEIGINQNMISLVIREKTKLPLERVQAFAKALKIDPMDLFLRCIEEYQPSLLEQMESMLNQPVLTDGESNLIKLIREKSGANFEFFLSSTQKQAFDYFLKTLEIN